MVHELKTWTQYFDDIIYRGKSFEVRKNDRDYQVGDTLLLKDWDNETQSYSGRSCERRVQYILHGGNFGIEEGYCVMGIKKAI